MQNFNQATLDAHLQAIASEMTPEQQQQFTERVKQRAVDSDVILTPEAVDGAADLLRLASVGEISLPDGPSADRLNGLLSHLSLPDVSLGPIGDLAGSAFGTVQSGAGWLFGNALGLIGKSGDVVSGVGSAASGAIDLAGSAGGAISGAAGSAMDLAGSAGGAIGDVASGAGDLIGGAGDLLGASGEVAGVILGALGDVLGGLDF